MLSPYRVLDLTDHRGQLAGAILASLGADVVLIEPPEGSPDRKQGPFHGELSLSWWAYNQGKRSAVVDLESEHFRDLLAGADVVIESGLGPLDRSAVAAANPALIHVTVSPFGLDGPKAAWPASDLTIMVSACQLALTGDGDRAPLRAAVPQAWLHAGAEAAAATVLALVERARSGRGQRRAGSQRIAGGLRIGRLSLRFVYPAADGFVSIMHNFSNQSGPYTARLMQYAHEEGHCDSDMRDADWIDYVSLLHTGELLLSHFEQAMAVVASLTASKPKADLFAEAQRRRLLLAPVANIADLLASQQLATRHYFEDVEDPDLGTVRMPGAFARPSATPLVPLGRAPRLGEHTTELLAEPARQPCAPKDTADRQGDTAPLAGLKVLDFTWVYAGPLTTRLLADFGATVIRVESSHRPDSTRGAGPFLDREPGNDSSVQFSHFNAGKLGLSLDLGTDEARSVVALSTCLMGQSGPLASFAGFGNLAGAISGSYELTGWPDRPPAGPFLAYTDYIAPAISPPCCSPPSIGVAAAAEASPSICPRRNVRSSFSPPPSWTGNCTSGRGRGGAMPTVRLASPGVPAHVVQNSNACAADAQLLHRGHFHTIAHHVHGSVVVEGPRAKLSRTPGQPLRSGPSFGEHADYVLRELLGCDDERITELVLAEALE